MTVHVAPHRGDFAELARLERRAFAAKLRISRAVLGVSQSEFGHCVGLTQRAVHKLERGETEPRRATVYAVEDFWHHHNIEFETLVDGGFRVVICPLILSEPRRTAAQLPRGRTDLGVTAIHRTASAN